ncbi:MAG: hypothetical protein J3Q66DRAFT_358474 [Benniella sp.]|nr:MAG: hypothetical protein J3Q66DRAFT_358474 [Benniella sp.]
MEQRKCEFLMDQISALQRGYDALRQEKVTLELQLDLLERQQQHHQQQQLKYQSRGRAIGKEHSAALSKALAIMVASPTTATANPLSIPSTPLLPTISAAEQEREKARIQFELEQAQVQAQKEAEEKEAQRLAAKAAAEEAEREAIRLKRAKSMHLKETLASLEAKRSDSRNVQITHPDELKHLEHLRHLNGEELSQRSSSSESFHHAAPSRVSRWIGSPFSSASSFWSQPSSSSASPSPLSSSVTTPSSPSAKQAVQYTHSTKHPQRSAGRLNGTFTYDVEQCSCCLGTVIDI